ncbi:MAG TPA: hypothetical protein VMH20_07675 [Verrucomicrobiae bacterium]|nr:hypothetical protein [Verrucomicrobiae bacterium]
MRPALLVRCSRKEAEQVRKQAALQRRTVSGYVIHIVMRSVHFSAELVSSLGQRAFFKLGRGKRVKAMAPRTALHIYCAAEEARRIRGAASQRKMSISGFVLECVHRSWETERSAELMAKTAAERKARW